MILFYTLKKSRFLALFLLTISTAQSQDILWEKSYGGKHAEYLFDVIPTPDYGFILAGSSLSKKTGNKTEDNRGDLDYWVWKMDEKGELDWQKSFGGTGQDILRCVLLTNEGGFLLAGSSQSAEGLDKKESTKGQSDFWIIKLNAQGGEEWQKTIGGSGQDDLTAVVRTKDGGFVIGGSSSSEKSGDKSVGNFGGLDYWVLKLDKDGKIVWQQTFGGDYNDELRSIAITQDGGYLLGGSSNSSDVGTKTQKSYGASDYWIIKLDKDGNEQWQKTIGGKGDDQLYVVHTAQDGNYLLGGNSNSETGDDKRSSNESGTDFWVIKLDQENKDILWQETYNISKVDILTSLVENDDRSILLGGYAQGSRIRGNNKTSRIRGNDKLVKGTADYVAIKLNEKGEEKWRKDVGSDGEDILKKVIETRDGGYLMAGTSKGKISNDRNTSKGGNDFWVVKLKDKQKPKEKKEPIQAIPNPAVDFTNVIVGYEFEKGTATVVDLAGHVLQTFEIKERTVPIDLQGYPEGIYIVNIKTEKQSDGVKVIKGRKR
ncbi:T9SS type A sorting domain-containing protein [Flavobacterium dankookense]|uniref:Putative secreted protein (Por secretion system target) n=1 Tax=Flavobacterium dankookense TaxID=706186 RepID=A0A4R6Q8N8_9FLAO|nr:T9SS type A sorting domain-containing protein [Flavobacterium dankookense]TDP58621.1 putative secreted protein (Por secretion system target) [Flavobacterium dankookense]